MSSTESSTGGIRSLLGKREIAVISLLIFLVLFAFWFPLDEILLQITEWSRANPTLTTWLVGSAFAVGILLLLPVAPIAVLAGFLMGLGKGFLVIWIAGLIASTLAFGIGRTAARPWVERKFADNEFLAGIDHGVEKKGLWLALTARLAFVLPFGPVSYACGASRIRFRDYLIGTNFGAIPPYLLVVHLGTTAGDLAAVISGEISLGSREILVATGGLVLIAFLVFIIARSAVKSLRTEFDRNEPAGKTAD